MTTSTELGRAKLAPGSSRFARADNRLSLAASTLWRWHDLDHFDYQMDGSGDCGQMIHDSHYARDVAMLAEHGFTPGEFNAALRQRMQGDGRMTLKVYELMSVLAVDACPVCGGALNVTAVRTRAYGGGWDTFERCAAGCDYAEVYV